MKIMNSILHIVTFKIFTSKENRRSKLESEYYSEYGDEREEKEGYDKK